jgi:hypothetical protein
MGEAENLVAGLKGKDINHGCACLKQLQALSEASADVYPYFDTFAEMLGSENSYLRTRAILLIAANAKWDTEFKLDAILPEYLEHISDDKPITARQCIQALPQLVKGRPDLKEEVIAGLQRANPGKYNGSMSPLVQKDIQNALEQLRAL